MAHLGCYVTLLILLQHFIPLQIESTLAEKRDLIHFARLVTIATGRSAIDFYNYGNYCGYGGGGIPLDEIDNCCRIHDSCYRYVEVHKHCQTYTIMSMITETYSFGVADDEITCSEKNKDCSQKICTCDKFLGNCLKLFVSKYNKTYKG